MFLYYFQGLWLLFFHGALFTFAAPVVEIALKHIIIIREGLTSMKQMMGMVLGSMCTEE